MTHIEKYMDICVKSVIIYLPYSAYAQEII